MSSNVLAVYKALGYTGEQAITGTKSIDNWFSHNPKKNWNNLIKLLPQSKIRMIVINRIHYDMMRSLSVFVNQ